MLRRIADEINERDIEGSTAELDVYRGDFSKYINQVFPNRKLYLFDTFSGFDKEDVKYERQEYLSESKQGDLCNEDINVVLDKMINEKNCVIKKGYFPDTADGLEEEFVFVRDYNNCHYPVVKKAVKEYCDNNISYLPMNDYGGNIIIIK